MGIERLRNNRKQCVASVAIRSPARTHDRAQQIRDSDNKKIISAREALVWPSEISNHRTHGPPSLDPPKRDSLAPVFRGKAYLELVLPHG